MSYSHLAGGDRTAWLAGQDSNHDFARNMSLIIRQNSAIWLPERICFCEQFARRFPAPGKDDRGRGPLRKRAGRADLLRLYFRPAFSRIAASVARPLSVSVYAPLSRSCAMNPRMAMDCIAWARMPTAAWSHRRGRCSHRTTIPGTGTRELEGERRVGWQRGKFKGGAVGDFVLGLVIGGSIALGWCWLSVWFTCSWNACDTKLATHFASARIADDTNREVS